MAGRFESMEKVAEEFGGLDIGLSAFPLTDGSPASDWALVRSAKSREAWGVEWKARREAIKIPMEPRDLAAILAYDVDGARLDAKLGYPCLGLWLEALQWRDVGGWALDRSGLRQKLPGLLETGASLPAFQALYPEGLFQVLGCVSADERGRPLWAEAELLLGAGWSPNQWSPLSRPEVGMSSMQSALHGGSRLCERPGRDSGALPAPLDETQARWASLLGAAMRVGFDLDSRSLDGQSSLGLCLATRPQRVGGGAGQDPRVAALLGLGAAPEGASRFWASCFEPDEALHSRMLGRLESSQIAAAARADAPASKRKPGL